MSGEHASSCAACGSPADADQRYCLRCGDRLGSRSAALEQLIARIPERAPNTPETAIQAVEDEPSKLPPPFSLRLPGKPVSALLVALFLGFGLLIGNVTGSPSAGALAAARTPALQLELPPPTASASTPTGSVSEAETEPPESEAEETPEPAETGGESSTSEEESSSKQSEEESTEEEGKEKAGAGAEPKPLTKLPAIKHVFLIVLSDQPYAALFGPESKAHYLSGALEKKGELLLRYDAIAHEELPNEIALVSGQGPTDETAADCPNYAPIAPGGSGAGGQVLGNGCIYPSSTETIGSQLEAKHLSWRAYVEGSDEAPGQPAACNHPASGAADPSSGLTPGEGSYATDLDPFLYFQSVTGSTSRCASETVGLSQLKRDLVKPSRTPRFAYIAPDRCDDGNPQPCKAGATAGPAAADGFIKRVVPEIMASKAYQQDGLIVVTGDEAPSSGEFADSSSCCGQPTFPNVPADSGPRGPKGGGAVGALLLSPFVKGASTAQEPFNHFALLRTFEDLFGLSHLGYAGASGVKSLPPALFVAKG
ncbi:MAG TPA: alkaline phosphatase family protein [Solirubrobacteraceae bacterium]